MINQNLALLDQSFVKINDHLLAITPIWLILNLFIDTSWLVDCKSSLQGGMLSRENQRYKILPSSRFRNTFYSVKWSRRVLDRSTCAGERNPCSIINFGQSPAVVIKVNFHRILVLPCFDSIFIYFICKRLILKLFVGFNRFRTNINRSWLTISEKPCSSLMGEWKGVFSNSTSQVGPKTNIFAEILKNKHRIRLFILPHWKN